MHQSPYPPLCVRISPLVDMYSTLHIPTYTKQQGFAHPSINTYSTRSLTEGSDICPQSIKQILWNFCFKNWSHTFFVQKVIHIIHPSNFVAKTKTITFLAMHFSKSYQLQIQQNLRSKHQFLPPVCQLGYRTKRKIGNIESKGMWKNNSWLQSWIQP